MFFTVVMLENVLLRDMSLKECKIIRPRLDAYAFLSWERSLSCCDFCDMRLRFIQSHLKNSSNVAVFYDNQGVLHRWNPHDFYPLLIIMYERRVTARNPVGSDDGGTEDLF